jgi:hypothetical protein
VDWEFRESAVRCVYCLGRFDVEILILVVDCSNHRLPWPCEPGRIVESACLPDFGERWHSDIRWC